MIGQAEVVVAREIDYFPPVEAGHRLACRLEHAQALVGARLPPSLELLAEITKWIRGRHQRPVWHSAASRKPSRDRQGAIPRPPLTYLAPPKTFSDTRCPSSELHRTHGALADSPKADPSPSPDRSNSRPGWFVSAC